MELDDTECIGGAFRDGKSRLSVVGSDRVGDALQQGVLGLQQFVLAREELVVLVEETVLCVDVGVKGLRTSGKQCRDALQRVGNAVQDLIVHNKVHSFNIKFGEK